MTMHKEVYVVMAGLIALKEFNTSSQQRDLAIFVRDAGHELKGRIYEFDGNGTSVEKNLPLANRRVSFSWDPPSNDDVVYRRRESPNQSDPPTNEDEAEELRVPDICMATDRSDDVRIDPHCVDERPIRRAVAAQVLLAEGTLCSGHLVSLGGLVPQLYFRGEGMDLDYATCADVMVLKLQAPNEAEALKIELTMLNYPEDQDEDEHKVAMWSNLSSSGPIVVSLTNQSRPVGEIPPVAAHFRMYRRLLKKVGGSSGWRPRVYIPRLRGGHDSHFGFVQPGLDVDNIEGVTPPSVQSRPMCPFTKIP